MIVGKAHVVVIGVPHRCLTILVTDKGAEDTKSVTNATRASVGVTPFLAVPKAIVMANEPHVTTANNTIHRYFSTSRFFICRLRVLSPPESAVTAKPAKGEASNANKDHRYHRYAYNGPDDGSDYTHNEVADTTDQTRDSALGR